MTKRPSNRSRPRDRAIVPDIAGRAVPARRLLNVLVFGLAVLGGEWLVHQSAYLIEYGSRFDAVMAATPHRYYMGAAGILLALVSLATAALGVVALRVLSHRYARLRRALPPRLQARVPTIGGVSLRQVGRTAAVLATAQIALYLFQENLEVAAVGGGAPGLGVLLGGTHFAVLPLHVLVATCSALLLWTAARCLNRAHHSVRFARLLLAVLGLRRGIAPLEGPGSVLAPESRRDRGMPGLRSPPPGFCAAGL